ncbi:MAG TPA: NAD(P)-binding domain-containing protein [Trebonia sp.]|nr:NAD(P)-binding domain-containing protein [Trebonia sp.]
MKLAIVGVGRLGCALGKRLAVAGHEIIYAQGPAARSAAFAHPHARAAASADAVRDADLTILTVPFGAVPGTLADCGDLDGKLIWSCVPALKPDASGLEVGFDQSVAETVQRLASGARVVGAVLPCAEVVAAGLNQFGGARPTTWMCGGERRDKAVISRLLEDLGTDPVDAGGLAAARLIEPAMALVERQARSVEPPRMLALRMIEQGWEQLDHHLALLA